MEFQVIFLSSLFFVNGNKLVEEKSSSFKKETLAQLTFFFLMLQRLTNFLVNLRQEGTINNWSFCAKFDALTLSHVILSNGLEWLQLHFASGDIEIKLLLIAQARILSPAFQTLRTLWSTLLVFQAFLEEEIVDAGYF